MERSWQGTVVLDLHGKNAYQARIAVDAALRRADRGVYRLRVIHGHNRGTVLRDLLSTYAAHEKVLRVAQYNAGTTDLILREMYRANGEGGTVRANILTNSYRPANQSQTE